MVMKMFSDKEYSNAQIGKIIGVTSQDVADVYRKTKYKLKKHLIHKYGIDENIY
jgi:DNA-directed RNA polymerase specialized sigma subunit